MENLTAGRVVHVISSDGEKCQPAIVVTVWHNGMINAVVFRDGLNDNRHDGGDGSLARWATSLRESGEPNGFHDPRECPRA